MPKPKFFFHKKAKQQPKGGASHGAAKKEKALFNVGQKQPRAPPPHARSGATPGDAGPAGAAPGASKQAARAGSRLAPRHAEGDALLDSFKQRLAGSAFRLLNEQLYTTPSPYAAQLLRDEQRFREYHDGYRSQLAMWPTNPNRLVVDALLGDRRGRFFLGSKAQHVKGHIPPGWVVADMGCGEAGVASALDAAGHGHVVHSFDLCTGGNPRVTVSDIAHTPLGDGSVDIVVFCLALMSTNWFDFLLEAHRVLKHNKLLKIVEVRSRLPKPEQFVALVEHIGFRCLWWDTVDTHFTAFDFVKGAPTQTDADDEDGGARKRKRFAPKPEDAPSADGAANTEPRYPPNEVLLPCLYRRR